MTEDERLKKIEADKQAALNTSNNTYNELLNDNQSLYDKQNQYAEDWQKTQDDLVNKQTEFNIGEIEKQKEKSTQAYDREAVASKNAYYDYINPYGANAETKAQNGLSNTGYSETAQSMAWNTQQNRTAIARSTWQNALTEFDSDINQAYLTRDTTLAQNALSKLQMQMEYLQNYMNINSTLKQSQLSYNQELNNTYYGRTQDTINQINYEKEAAEKLRQYNEQFAYQKQQDTLAQANWQKEYALAQQQAKKVSSSSNKNGGGNEELTDNTVVKNLNYSITLSNASATNLFDVMTSAVSNGNYTKSDIANQVSSWLNSKKITKDDASKILKYYGIN